MPDPTRRDIPKGQAQGEAQAQEAFAQETAMASPVAQPVVDPTLAAITPNAIEPEFAEPEFDEEEDADQPIMVGLEDGDIDLSSILFGPTQRPEEAITAGIQGIPAATPKKVSESLADLMRRGYATPDVEALFEAARQLGV